MFFHHMDMKSMKKLFIAHINTQSLWTACLGGLPTMDRKKVYMNAGGNR